MQNPPLHITVAAIPNAQGEEKKLLNHELRLTKASVLYADKVKLCSLGAWLATSLHFMGVLPQTPTAQLELIMQLRPALEINNPSVDFTALEKALRLLKRKSNTLTKKDAERRKIATQIIPEVWHNVSHSIDEILNHAGFDEIKLAIDEECLELHPFLALHDELVHEYFGAVEEMLGSTSTHPMLDEQTGDLVRLAIEEGKFEVRKSGAKKSKQTGLLIDLFDRLPVFDIPMDELLDVRKELRRPLVNFRAEVVKLGSDIEHAVWDKDFPADVQNIVHSRIEPALLEIEDKLESAALKKLWVKNIIERWSYLAGATAGTYYLGASVAPIWGIVGGLVTAGLFLNHVKNERNDKLSEIERHGLYFYYKMKNRK